MPRCMQDVHQSTFFTQDGMHGQPAIRICLDGLDTYAKIVRQQDSDALSTVKVNLTVRIDCADLNEAVSQ